MPAQTAGQAVPQTLGEFGDGPDAVVADDVRSGIFAVIGLQRRSPSEAVEWIPQMTLKLVEVIASLIHGTSCYGAERPSPRFSTVTSASCRTALTDAVGGKT